MKVTEYREFVQKQPPKTKRRYRHKEDDLEKSCRKWFDLTYKHLKVLLHHSPNEGLLPKSAKDGAKRKEMGVRAGFPDFILLVSNNDFPFLAIELKTEDGKQSDSQKDYQKAIETAGGRYVICRSLDDFMTEINDYLSHTTAYRKPKQK